jgi:DNA polymerase III epsilon subunit-like protein
MAHVMIDLETLGVYTDSIILSIGAVKFAPDKIKETFHIGVDPQSCADVGMTVGLDTVMWWMKQDEESRSQLVSMERYPLEEMLSRFSEWIHPDDKVWGNGAAFDNVILRKAYDLCGLETPWKFANDRCYRTIKSLRPDVQIKRIGTHHNALDDAITQAVHLIEILKTLKHDV